MEGLQDAILDAEYMGHIMEEGIRPIKKIELPSDVEASAFRKSWVGEGKGFSEIMHSPLGLFFFYSFLRGIGREEEMDFLVAVEQYRSCTMGNVRVNVARMIFRSYFKSTQPEEAAAVSSSIEEAIPTKSEQYKIWLDSRNAARPWY